MFEYETLCKELGISSYIQDDVDSSDTSIIRFIRFAEKYRVSEIRYVDFDFLDEYFKGLHGAETFARLNNLNLYDHARIMTDKLGFHYLLLQPYNTEENCKKALKSSAINNIYVIDNEHNFYDPEGSSLILIFEDKLSTSTIKKTLGL